MMVGSAAPHDIINVGNYMGQASVFNINNNILLYPDWSDEYTMAPGMKNRESWPVSMVWFMQPIM